MEVVNPIRDDQEGEDVTELNVHHLIEKCMTFGMSMEECMEALSKRADVQPVVTSTVWKELEKENKEFFDRYNKQLRSEKGGRSSCSSSSDSSS
ncbi:hypothetical protein TRIUR3_28104 [Triticum urartu]|uniref:Uncharacterized protein n=1 Tax=Triticum urartu TaxID=4572 RepID=M7ZRE6_TRIUA|nr:hypothetical protein TRIUR3_28104 [Triticum urartu]